MARRKRNYKNNDLVTTFVNNRMVDAAKAKKERAREEAKAEKTRQRESAARLRGSASLIKKHEAEAKKRIKSDLKVKEAITKIAVRLTHEFEKYNIYNSEPFVFSIAQKCHELSYTPAKSFREFVLPFVEKYRLQSIEAYFLEKYGDSLNDNNSSKDFFQSLAVEFGSAEKGTTLEDFVKYSDNASDFINKLEGIRDRSNERRKYIERVRKDFFTKNYQDALDSLDDEDLTVEQFKNSPRIQELRRIKLNYISDIEKRLARFSDKKASSKSKVVPIGANLGSSPKKRLIALLCFVFFISGLPWLYLGRWIIALAQPVSMFLAFYFTNTFTGAAWLLCICWALIDFVRILFGKIKDGNGHTVKKWI